jgi:hypothetical protein
MMNNRYNMANNFSFRLGFLKAAAAAGCSYERAQELYRKDLHKLAFNDLPLSSDDASDFKNTLRQEGNAPVLGGGPQQDFQAQQYSQHAIERRDQLARQNPDIAEFKGALGGGAAGAGIGGLAGWLGGHGAARYANPRMMGPRLMSGLPGWGRTAGMIGGALLGGVPGAVQARHKVETARKLEDPRNLDSFVRQLAQERQLANNQFN